MYVCMYDVVDKLRKEFPGLTEEDIVDLQYDRGPASNTPDLPGENDDFGRADDESSSAASAEEFHIADEDTVADDLRRLRAVWETEHDVEDGFYVKVLGGSWTKANKGVLADGVAVFARNGLANVSFCVTFDLPKQRSFAYTLHGMIGAHALVDELCRKSIFFFNMWLFSDDDAFRFTDGMIASYVDSVDFTSFVDGERIDSVCYSKALLIRALKPQN
jgi:hypothetical protein